MDKQVETQAHLFIVFPMLFTSKGPEYSTLT